MRASSMACLGRRALLTAVLLAPVVPLRAFGRQAPAISLDEFLRLSQRLVERTSLDPDVAKTYLDALVSDPVNIPLLARLAAGPGADLMPAHLALERTILEWWYTGTYTAGGERRLATHTGALMWAALGMPAPGTCAGPFGAWSRPPRTMA